MNKIIAWVMLITFCVLTLVATSYGSQEEGWHLVPSSSSREVYRKVSVPKELSFDQLKSLKSDALDIGTLSLSNTDGVVGKTMPSKLRVVSNQLFKRYKAVLTECYTLDEDHLSTFHAVYEVENWPGFVFTIIGVDRSLQDAVEVRDIDLEAFEAPKVNTLLTLGYNSPLATYIRMDPDIIFAMEQFRMIEALQMMEMAQQLGDSDATRAMIMSGAKFVISTALAPMVQKYVPGAKYAYEFGLPVCKTLGYPTFTHFISGVVEDRRIKSPLFEANSDTNVHEVDHAISRGLGSIVKFVPGGSFLRNLGTKAVQMKGYPTITHFVFRHRDMSQDQILESRASLQLAEDAVAIGVESIVPFGVILVAVSQNSAKLFLGESSMTKVLLKKLLSKSGNN